MLQKGRSQLTIIKDVSKMCHVSVYTVSRALNGYDDINYYIQNKFRVGVYKKKFYKVAKLKVLISFL